MLLLLVGAVEVELTLIMPPVGVMLLLIVVVAVVEAVAGHAPSPGRQSVAPTHALPFFAAGASMVCTRCSAGSQAAVQGDCSSTQSTFSGSETNVVTDMVVVAAVAVVAATVIAGEGVGASGIEVVPVVALVVGATSQLDPENPLTQLHVQPPVTPSADPPFAQAAPLAPPVQPPAVPQSAPPHPSSHVQV